MILALLIVPAFLQAEYVSLGHYTVVENTSVRTERGVGHESAVISLSESLSSHKCPNWFSI